ncbi:MAG: YdeI/OmpD-associated family protein [Candidatus Peribacteria bacterium]|nr:MAG: YdeI/OmpD-associated family protein [Candidatus Peribacteria bacterium]
MTNSFLHELPDDMQRILGLNPQLQDAWNLLTSLAQNEWICWVSIVKKEATRNEHLERWQSDILAGKKRPCCWPGCPHRNEKAKKWFK